MSHQKQAYVYGPKTSCKFCTLSRVTALVLISPISPNADRLNVQNFTPAGSKGNKIYANRILGEQNLYQKVRKFCQTLNHEKIMHLIKYSLTVHFLIKDYTQQLHNYNLLNIEVQISNDHHLLP